MAHSIGLFWSDPTTRRHTDAEISEMDKEDGVQENWIRNHEFSTQQRGKNIPGSKGLRFFVRGFR